MNFCGPYRGREILNVRPRPQNTFRILCPLCGPRNTHFAAFEEKNYIYYDGRNLYHSSECDRWRPRNARPQRSHSPRMIHFASLVYNVLLFNMRNSKSNVHNIGRQVRALRTNSSSTTASASVSTWCSGLILVFCSFSYTQNTSG